MIGLFRGDRSENEKISRGYGFVKYNDEGSAAEAQKLLDGKEFYGKKWSIQFSKTEKPRAKTPGQYLGHKKRSDYERY